MKRILWLLLVITLVCSMSLTVFAKEGTETKTTEAASGEGGTGSNLVNKVNAAGNQIIDIIGTVAMIVGVVMVIIAGIKYMMAPAGGKADVKSNIMPLLIGGVLVGASGWLAPAIINWGKSL